MATQADLWREVDRLKTINQSINAGWDHATQVRLANEILAGGRSLSQIRQDALNRISGNRPGTVAGGVNNSAPPKDTGTPAGGGGTNGGGGTAPATFNAEAAATITGYLREMGMEGVESEVDRLVRRGMSWPEIQLLLEDRTSTLGRQVERLYPEYFDYRDANQGGPPITIAAIQQYRQQARQLIDNRGLGEAFPDVNAQVRKWIVGGVDLEEVGQRFDLLEGYVAASPGTWADAEAWTRFYGVAPTLGQLTAMAINPQEALPRLQRQFASVRLDVEAGRAGFGDLSVNEAESIAETGATDAAQRFGALAASKELFSPLDRGEDEITRQEQISAGFGLQNADAARRRIEQRAARRTARFQGGGALATSRSGFGGLSTSSDT